MSTTTPRILREIAYYDAAHRYLRSLPPEHFMEATAQGRQREISIESFALVKVRRPDFHYFNELLVQYPYGRGQKIHQVVPDNMIVMHDGPIEADGSYDVPFQPARPFWMLEYVSKHNKRKDYTESFGKYEQELKTPYALFFYPDDLDLRFYRHTGKKYHKVALNAKGRYPVPKLNMDVALLNGWVRFWFQGELVPLPEEMQRSLDETQQLLARSQAQLTQAQDLIERERREKERLLARLRELGEALPP